MRSLIMACAFLGALWAGSAAAAELEVIASLDQRPGNVAVGPEGRIFVTMHPFDHPQCKLIEIKKGKAVPYPHKKMICGSCSCDFRCHTTEHNNKVIESRRFMPDALTGQPSPLSQV